MDSKEKGGEFRFFLPTLINKNLILVYSCIGSEEKRMFRTIHDIQEDDANHSFDKPL